jgi:serine/threonine-protein kinase
VAEQGVSLGNELPDLTFSVSDGSSAFAKKPNEGSLGPLTASAMNALNDDLDETSAFAPEPSEWDEAECDDLVNSTLGQYRIVEEIGRGSMGRVFKSFHSGLGRICAVKVLSPTLVTKQPRVVDWFQGEARAIAGLIHPHIVTIHNLGWDRGYHYVEMEYVSGGQTLKEIVARKGALDPLEATRIIRHVALALDEAHRSGLIHRDVKPANVLMTPDNRAKLADFGLVRRLREVSQSNNLAGTPTFMAPELFAGTSANSRTDLYAVGVTFYYLVTARLPFAAERLGHLIKLHRSAPVPDPRLVNPNMPDELANLLLRLLSKDPALRPESASALIEQIDIVEGHLRDTDGLVRDGLAGLDCLIQKSATDLFRVIVPVPGDRLHEVYIEVVEGRKRERLLTVFSVCAPADARHYEFALRLNAELTYGGLSIRHVNGAPMFVMSRTYARGNVTPSDIRAAVVEIARRGDWVEQQLTSTDLY